MAGPKFFIYGGSRWREINTSSGQVDGWGKLQFLSVKQGRLQVARTNSVLRGLRDLACNKPTSVRDSLPLSQIRQNKAIEEESYKETKCLHHCCCQQSNNCKLNNNILKAPTSSASIQCTLSQTRPNLKNNINSNLASDVGNSEYDFITLGYPKVIFKKKSLKRLAAKRKKSKSDDDSVSVKTILVSSEGTEDISLSAKRKQAKAKIVKKVQNNLIKSTKRKHSTSGNESGERLKKIKSSNSGKKSDVSREKQESPKRLLRSVRTQSNSEKSLNHSQEGSQIKNYPKKNSSKKKLNSTITLSSGDESIEVSPSIIRKKSNRQSVRLSRLSKVNDDKPIKASSNNDSIKKSQNTANDDDKPRTRKIFNFSIDSDTEDTVQQVTTKAQMHTKLNRIEKENNAKSKEKPKESNRTKLLQSDSKYRKHKLKPKRKQSSDVSSSISKDVTSKEPFKELFIGEDDVMLLRTFVENDKSNVFKVDLERFDSDDIYKSKIFYKINPLVNVVRSRRIARLLEKRSRDNTVSLEDFISNLGLRSVLDTSSQASSSKYKMRSRQKPIQKSGEDKENKQMKNNTKIAKRDKVFSERVNKNINKVSKVTQPRLSDVLKSVKVTSESDSNFEGSRKVSKERVKRPKPVIAVKRGLSKPSKGNREYSRAEDEAIVLWVRKGGRASRVKGNQLWRELQPAHQLSTGLFRSWHSLRNRYLRYLLPALGSLSLSPSEASRLRAAAAAGNVKSRKDQRENSILAQPRVHSAWSRRPRNLPTPSPRSSRSLSPPPRRSPSPSPSRRSTPPSPFKRHASSSKRFKPSSPPSRRTSAPSRQTSNYSSQSIVSDTDSSSEASKRTSATSSAVKSAKTKPTRTLRSSNITPSKPTDTHIPTYSELTKKYATKDDDSFTENRQLRSRKSDQKPGTRRLYNPNI